MRTLRNPRLVLLLAFVAFAMAAALVWPFTSRADPGSGDAAKLVPVPDPTTAAAPSILPRKAVSKRKRLLHKIVRRTAIHVPMGERVVKYARHLIGTPYVYGGSSPRTGFDCSGFVRYVYAHFGVSLAHSSFSDFVRGRRVGRWAMKPGDLVFFDGAGHVGIYVGKGRFIHAPHTGTVVRISTMAGWYSSRFDGARRVS